MRSANLYVHNKSGIKSKIFGSSKTIKSNIVIEYDPTSRILYHKGEEYYKSRRRRRNSTRNDHFYFRTADGHKRIYFKPANGHEGVKYLVGFYDEINEVFPNTWFSSYNQCILLLKRDIFSTTYNRIFKYKNSKLI